MTNHSIDPKRLRGQVLTRQDFSGRSLVGADFSGSVCIECDFSNSDLSHANFEKCDLYKAKFSQAVLYATRFSDSNLTRCLFDGAYIYGMQIIGYSNVTYATLEKFALEERRRHSHADAATGNTKESRFGERINTTEELCRHSYHSNGFTFTFEKLHKHEQHAQRSQVYNRLKRLYQSNGYREEALACQYLERFHRTRSLYKYDSFTGEEIGTNPLKRLAKTFVSFVGEQVSGYGLKPLRVLRNILLLRFL